MLKFYLLGLILCLLWVCAGCLNLAQRPRLTPVELEKADLLAGKLEHWNAGLTSFKGKGRIVVLQGKTTQSARILMIGDQDVGLRLMLLDIAGRPSLSLATDKRCFYYHSHADSKFHTQCTQDPNLEQFLTVPVRFSDFEPLFYGRIPVKKHYQTFYLTEGEAHVLGLETRWGRRIQTIRFSPDMQYIQSAVVYRNDGEILYEIEFMNTRLLNGHYIPFSLRVTGENRTEFRLTLDHYEPEADVSALEFVLKKPSPAN